MSALGPVVISALRRVLRRQWLVTFEMPVPPTGPLDVAPPPGVVIRLGTANDARALAPLLVGREPMERRFARGDVVLVAELDGRLVGCQWITGGPFRLHYHRGEIALRPRERYCYGLYVLPEARRRGVAAALERALLPEAQRVGTMLYFCHVSGWNRVSLAMHSSVGWIRREESVGIILLDRLAITPWRRRPGRPSHHAPRRMSAR